MRSAKYTDNQYRRLQNAKREEKKKKGISIWYSKQTRNRSKTQGKKKRRKDKVSAHWEQSKNPNS